MSKNKNTATPAANASTKIYDFCSKKKMILAIAICVVIAFIAGAVIRGLNLAIEFEGGTMLPKIEAAVSYLEKVRDGKVLITSMAKVKDAVKGKAGTVITA